MEKINITFIQKNYLKTNVSSCYGSIFQYVHTQTILTCKGNGFPPTKNERILFMKLDRLIGILAILLQREKVTAPFLAETFEVSRRTINRDIESLCQAGIPIVTTQGKNGGISIVEGYRVDRTILTSKEMQAILIGLKSLDSVSGTKKYQQLMEKMSANNSSVLVSNQHILIDLSASHKNTLVPKIELIQNAIDRQSAIEFQYYSQREESLRNIHPYVLIFQWSSWYVWGYCLDRKDYRLFKLNRMVDLKDRNQYFEKRDIPKYEDRLQKISLSKIQVMAICEADIKWRLVEIFGIDSFQEQEDGRLLVQFECSDKEYLFSWILNLGNQIELLEPKELRKELAMIVKQINKKYNKHDK